MKEKKPTVKKKSLDLSEKIKKLEMIYDDLVREVNRIKSRLGL
tara:strand:- start:162 stop:290 length:129 start_codon:yes stop_codon:yes gene_type:complete